MPKAFFIEWSDIQLVIEGIQIEDVDQFLDFVSTFVFLLVDKANSIFFNQFLTRFLEWVGNEGEVSFLNICGKKNLRDDFVREHLLEAKEVNQVSISFI